MLEDEEEDTDQLLVSDINMSSAALSEPQTGKAEDREQFVEKPMQNESAQEVEIAKSNSLFGNEKEGQFYLNQFNMIYESGLDIQGKNATAIVAELKDVAFNLKPRPRQFTKDQLKNIKTEPDIQSNLTAELVKKDLEICNGGTEFRDMDQMKEFIGGKKKRCSQRMVKQIKANKKVYIENDEVLRLNNEEFLEIGENGKHVELTCDAIGNIYVICKHIEENGPHITVYELDIETGELSEAILNETLVQTIEYDISRPSFQVADSALKGSVQSISELSKSGARVSRIASWANDDDTEIIKVEDDLPIIEEIVVEKQEIKKGEVNQFNKLWIKRGEFIYFFKVTNDKNRQESDLFLMRFNLTTKQFIQIKQSVVKKETVIVHNNEGYKKTWDPFGVQAVIFQDQPDGNILQDGKELGEIVYMDKQFVLLVGENWKAISLRKVTDLSVNLIYFETSQKVSWNIFRFDKQRGTPYIPVSIGAVTKLKTYASMFEGTVSRLNGKNWVFNYEDLETQKKLFEDLGEKYRRFNNQIYSLSRTIKDRVIFQKQQMLDLDHKIKQSYMELMEIQLIPIGQNQTIYKKNSFMKNLFPYNTFFILQNLSSDKSWVIISQNNSNQIKIVQLKTAIQELVLKSWNIEGIHPITKMQYRHSQNGANLVQVHPFFHDIISNGERFLSYDKQSNIMASNERVYFKPKYYEEYYDDQDTQFSAELPSTIFQQAFDDRKIVPRMGIEEKFQESMTYIDVHETVYQHQFFNSQLQKQVRHDVKPHTLKTVLLINAWRYGWKNMEISGNYQLTAFQPSSSVQLVDDALKKYMQNWQMAIMDQSRLFMYIYEYRFEWCEIVSEASAEMKNYRFTYLGKILVVLKQPWIISKRLLFLPYYTDSRNSLIGGTQLIPEFESSGKIHLIFKNQTAEDVQFKTNLSLCSYKILKNTKRRMTGFMIKARMVNDLLDKYSDTEKNIIFDSQHRVLANMQLALECDIDRFVTNLTSENPQDPDLTLVNNRPNENLNGQSSYDYLTVSPNIYTKLRTGIFEQYMGTDAPTLLHLLSESMDDIKREQYLKSIYQNLPDQFECSLSQMSDDLFFNNQFYRCFDDMGRRFKSCQCMITFALKQPTSKWIQARMMHVIPFITNDKIILEDYGKFFIDYDGRDQMTTFAIKLKEANLPEFGSKNELCRNFEEVKNSNSNINRFIAQQIINESNKDDAEKSIPSQHFVIDFRQMILMNKLRLQLKDSPKTEKIQTMTKYDLHYIMYCLTNLYGNKIEQQDTLRGIIDYQFYNHTQKFFYSQIWAFIIFYLFPFGLQLFQGYTSSGVMQIIILLCHCSNFGMIIWLTWQKQMYWQINGYKKTVRNAQNIIDICFIFCNSVYFIIKVKDRFIDSKSETSLPTLHHNNTPTPMLGFYEILNVSIVILITIKILIFLRVNEEYGMLSQLVFATLIDTLPFTIFMFIWILIFCVIYKVQGSLQTQAETYQGIPSFFGYFFYNFNNAVANPILPTFVIWQNIQNNEQGKPWSYRKTLSKIMIYSIYFTWWINQIFIQIILLNFLISLICDSYQKVVDSEVKVNYQAKASLNRECLIILKALGRDDHVGTLILSANTEDESLNSQWYKFTSQVKQILRSGMGFLKNEVASSQESIQDKIEDFGEVLTKEVKVQNEILIKQLHQLADQTNNLK